MGYSCTAKAAETENTFVPNGQSLAANVWVHRNREYFFERGRENADGAITGTIYRIDPARRVSSYRINADGHIARAPYGLRERMSEELGLARYLKMYEPREAWRLACDFDGVDPNESFVVFSEHNPYA